MELYPQETPKQETPSPAPPLVEPDPLDTLLQEMRGRYAKSPVRPVQSMLEEAHKISSDRAARVLSAGLKAQLPDDLVEPNLEEIEADVNKPGYTVAALLADRPRLLRWMSRSPNYAAAIKDNIVDWANIEDWLTRPKLLWRKPDSELESKAKKRAETQTLAEFFDREEKRRQEAMRRGEVVEQITPHIYRAATEPGYLEQFYPPGDPNLEPTRARAERLKERLKGVQKSRLEEEVYQGELARLQDIERFVAGVGKVGVWENFERRFDDDPLWFVPLASGWMELGKDYTLYKAAEAINAGTPTEEQVQLFSEFSRINAAWERRGGNTFMAKVAGTLADSARIGVEFYATGGTASLGKMTLKEGLGVFLKQAVKNALQFTARTAMQTAIMQTPEIASATLRRMAHGEKLLDVLPGEILAGWGEIASESAGGLLDFMNKPLNKALFGWWASKHTMATIEGFQKALRKAGINTAPGEYGEERLSDFIRDIAGVEKFKWPSLEDSLAELLAFTAPHLAGAGLGRFVPHGSEERPVEEAPSDFFKAHGELLKESPLAKVGPEAAEILAEELSKDSDVEFVLTPGKEWNSYWQEQKDDDGLPMNPREQAIRAGVAPAVYDEAMKTGTDLQIPYAKYVSEFAGTDHNKLFEQSGKLAASELTAEEVKELRKRTKQPKEKERVEGQAIKIPESAQPGYDKARSEISNTISRQLRAAGLSKSEADAAAAIEAARSATRGKLRGEDPLEVYRRRAMEFQSVSEAAPGQEGHDEPPVEKSIIDDGPVFREFKGNTQGAIEALRKAGAGEAVDALHHPEVGHFDLIYGAVKRTKGKSYGLAKLIKWHPEVLDDLQGFINTLHFDKERSSERAIQLTSDDGRAGIQLDWWGTPKRWLITAFKIDPNYEANKKGPTSPGTLLDTAERPPEGGQRGDTARPPQVGPEKPTIPPSDFESDAKSHEEKSKSGQGGPRGRTIPEKDRFIVQLFKGRDRSTVLHEFGHVWLEGVREDVQFLAAKPEEDLTKEQKRFLAGANAVREWLGASSLDRVTKGQHDKFAIGAEKYFMEGKAPSAALRGAFYRFGQWLLDLYRAASQYFMGNELSPEVRDFFDHLLATEDEISAARADQQLQPLFEDLKAMGMSDAQAEEYAQALEEAHREAVEGLTEQTMENLRKKQEDLWDEERARIRGQIAKEVDQRPEYVALSILAKGEKPNGEEVDWAREGVRFSKETMEVRFPQHWPSLRIEPYVEKDGKDDPDVIAELLGYSSADHMFEVIKNTEPREQLLDRMADAKMEELHPELLADTEALRTAATQHVLNDRQTSLLRREMAYLASEHFAKFKDLVRTITGKVPTPQELKDEAKEAIGKKTSRELQPALFERAAMRAGTEAREALLKGDWQAAFDAKRQQLLNIAYFREATEAQEELRVISRYMRKAGRDSTLRQLGRAGHDYLAQVEDILERLDFMPASQRTVERRESLRDWYEREKKDGREPIVPEKLLDRAYRVHWKDAPYGELVEHYNAVQNIVHLAKTKNRLLASKAKREFDAAVDEAVASIEANSKPRGKAEIETRLPQQETGRSLKALLVHFRRYSSLIRQIDGFKDGGPLWELLVRPFNEAGSQESAKAAEAKKQLLALFHKYSATEVGFATPALAGTPSFATGMYRQEWIPEIERSLSKMARIMVALNWGNKSSQQRLKDGYGWNDQQVNAILRPLTERDWEFVQGVWDLINSNWPEAKAMAQRVDGLAPDKIEAAPFEVTTPDGKTLKIAGGYFPAKYDDRQSKTAQIHDAKEAADRALRKSAVRAMTRHGYRESRVEKVNMPIRLDFGVIFEHFSEVFHDLTHYEALVDANRILRDPRIEKAIKERHGDLVYKELQNSVDAIAAGDQPSKNQFEAAVNMLRRGRSVAALSFKASTALLQPLGLSNSLARLGPKYFWKGVSQWFGNPADMGKTLDWLYQHVPEMKTRQTTMTRDLNEVRGQLRARQRVWSKIEDYGLWLIQQIQFYAVDVPTALGSYAKAIDESTEPASEDERVKMDKRAGAIAFQTVLDTQGGGQVKDLAAVLRGNAFQKLFTQFMTWYSARYNQFWGETVNEFRANKSPETVAKLAAHFVLLYSVPVVIGTFVLKGLLRGGPPPDDDKSFLKKLRDEHLAEVLGDYVVARDAAGLIKGYDYQGPSSVFQPFARLGKQVMQGEADEAFWHALIDTSGTLFHLPSGQFEATRRGFDAYLEGEAGPGAVLLGRPEK